MPHNSLSERQRDVIGSDHERGSSMTNLDNDSLLRETEANRKSERVLIPKALISLALVVIVLVVRQVFFL
jgi:hypothetical protein